MIPNEWITNIERALHEACPRAFASREAMQDVTSRILSFQQENGRLPDELTIITHFAVPHENRLLREAQDADIVARKKSRLDYLSGPSRESVNEELRKLRKPDTRKAFIAEDLSALSRDEFDKLPDSEIKRRLCGQESLDDLNRQGTKLDIEAPKNELDQHYRDRILKYRGNDPIMRSLKRQLLDGAEQRDVEYRRRVLEQQKDEKRKAQEELRKAGRK